MIKSHTVLKSVKKSSFFPKKFKIGAGLVAFLFFMSLASFFIPYSPDDMNLDQSYEWPSLEHPFGLDENGNDVFLQVLYGSRISFTVALSVVLISLIVGLIAGTVSGYYTKVVDPIVMRIVDMVYAFPHFLLAMALMAVLGPSVLNLILVMSLSTWASYARLVRGEVIHIKKKEFVVSASALGISLFRKIVFHIWPQLVSVLAVQTTITLAGVILAESGLSFLGIGVPPEIPTWGSLLRLGRHNLIEAPHLIVFPGMCLFLLILGFHLLGDGMREIFSPKERQKNKGSGQ